MERVRTLLAHKPGKGWRPETTAQLQVVFADALQTLGDQAGLSAYLVEAVENYRATLEEYTGERVPLDWA